MNAFIINQYGPPTVFSATKLSTPLLSAKEVLIKVHAAGFNPLDYKLRRGDLKSVIRLSFPKVLGAEIAGTVVGLGSEVTTFQPNDEVYAMLPAPHFGGYAEYVATDVKHVALIPKNLSFEEAASIPIAGLTAWQALRNKGNISRGSRVLINGASGGVGTFAVQIAKDAGAQITGVCSAANADLVKKLGATDVIDYQLQDFTQLPYQYDVVFDAIGNQTFSACKSILTDKGIYITTAASFKNIIDQVLSIFGGKKSKLMMVRPDHEDLYQLAQFTEADMLTPVIQKVYDATEKDLVEAHQQLESGHTAGKLVMRMNFPDADKE
jgi:NADPH:quinone reductase-like Zn-dependent oxidoreductase